VAEEHHSRDSTSSVPIGNFGSPYRQLYYNKQTILIQYHLLFHENNFLPYRICYTVKPLYYVHTRDQKISLYLLTRSLYLTWFVLNNEVPQYRKGPKFYVLINEVYLLKRGLLKRFYCIWYICTLWYA
jgi:hypothetical protein